MSAGVAKINVEKIVIVPTAYGTWGHTEIAASADILPALARPFTVKPVDHILWSVSSMNSIPFRTGSTQSGRQNP